MELFSLFYCEFSYCVYESRGATWPSFIAFLSPNYKNENRNLRFKLHILGKITVIRIIIFRYAHMCVVIFIVLSKCHIFLLEAFWHMMPLLEILRSETFWPELFYPASYYHRTALIYDIIMTTFLICRLVKMHCPLRKRLVSRFFKL